ncbi:SNF2 family N-terminal domain-containing protein [Nemania abortiva]|nr:SNF2 family N-terminal domain-containing protein [Nemania abortiva]
MKTALYNHQVIGVSWMLRREFSEDGPWGGILGDEMGMGKTLQALACIVSNKPTDEDLETYSPLTLVVAPATSLKQWEQEIRKHADGKSIGVVFQYRNIKTLPVEMLMSMTGIVLASYHEIAAQFPSKKLRTELQNDCRSAEEWKETWDNNLGALFKVPFWRVILDEAHNIKNKDTQMSVSCQSLLGKYRWGMSGTPITNSLDELYPYLKFLKTDWAGDLPDFQYLYGNTGDGESADRLAIIMNILMLRRTMEDRFMGRPLYEIPMCHISVRRVKLTKEERAIYNVVESHFRSKINDLLCRRRRRVPLRELKIILVYLLRLRQGVAHPFLLEPVMKKNLNKGDLKEIKSRLREIGGRTPVFKQIGKFNIDKQVDIALASQKEDVCRLCYQEPIDGYAAQCKHLFCKECLEDHIEEEFRDGRAVPKCPDCNKSLSDYEPMEQSDTDDSDTEDSQGNRTSRRIFGPPKQGLDSFKKHPKLKKKQSEFLRECDQSYPKPVVPSAKTVAVKEAILKWQAEAPDDKIIVFMEFKMTGAILGRMLNAEGIRFLYFFGDMPQKAKQNAIRGFHEKPDIKIASFRCGSVALNLACANRVILVDLWWNLAIEMQAFSRVFRIGQTKETHFLRLIAQNTVDNRMEALQEEKSKDIDMALKPGRKDLSVEKVAALFGHLQKLADGSLEVLPDCDDGAEVDETEEAETIGEEHLMRPS